MLGTRWLRAMHRTVPYLGTNLHYHKVPYHSLGTILLPYIPNAELAALPTFIHSSHLIALFLLCFYSQSARSERSSRNTYNLSSLLRKRDFLVPASVFPTAIFFSPLTCERAAQQATYLPYLRYPKPKHPLHSSSFSFYHSIRRSIFLYHTFYCRQDG
jgi:hypothetical protein